MTNVIDNSKTASLIANLDQLAQIEKEAQDFRRAIAAQRDTIVEQLTSQAETHLAAVNALLTQLNQLGMEYKPLALGVCKPAKGNGTKRESGHCDICNMDGHDARSHRNQPMGAKTPFTPAELTARGL